MFSSIRWRIAFPYILLIGLSMLVLTTYILRVGRVTYLESLKERLSAEALVVAEVMQEPLELGRSAGVQALASRYAELLQDRVTVLSRDGAALADSARDAASMDNHWYRQEVQQAIASGRGASVRYSETLREEMVYVAVPVRSGEDLVGVVRVAVPLSRLDATMSGLWRGGRWGIGLATLFALGLALLIAEATVRPVRSLTGVVRRMADGDLTAHLIPPTRDEIGELTLSFSEMATRLRESVSSLDRQRAQLAAVLDNMADGVLIVDDDGVVVLINPAAARILNLSPQEALQQSATKVLRQHEIVHIWEASRTKRSEQVEMVEIEREGLFLQVAVTPLREAEKGSYLILLQDLHHVRQLEAVRREFVSSVSHELEAPLASLKSLSETLIGGAVDDRERARRYVERIDREVDVLTQMTQELSELTRIESGQAPIRLTPVSLDRATQSAAERLRPQAERAGVHVAVDLPKDLPLVMGDMGRLRQVVMNLLHNAIKFTPVDGDVQISAEVVDDEVIVSVRDTGVGIPEDLLARIFERYRSRDRSRSGMGLGLALARHVVQGHGGAIWAESVEGKGSTFRFTLTIAEGAKPGLENDRS